ncbi:MAG: substrate-binding periplasmic protein [Pseudodesulfovibrio sp.]|uniref:substrate-binding periplasmic protein n=1 Tax=Pseudodesulfovibrio sp. TaxID=2035812 RepID=UPI003D095AC4
MRTYCIAILFLFLIVGTARASDFVFYVGEIFPFIQVSKSGEVGGPIVDVVSELMGGAGDPVRAEEFRSISFPRSLEILETTPGTGMFLLARTPQREPLFKWVGPLVELKLGLVARKSSNIVIRSKEDLKRYSISVVRNSGPMHLLQNDPVLKDVRREVVKDDVLQMRMLNAGRVDMVCQADTAAPHVLESVGLDPDDFEMVYVLSNLPLYLAFNRAVDDGFIARLQAAMDAMRKEDRHGRSRFKAIMRKYSAEGLLERNR